MIKYYVSVVALCAVVSATSAVQAKTLVCSNTGIITEEMVDIVASYNPEVQPENALVEGGTGEPADNAYFLIHSTEVGALHRCIANMGSHWSLSKRRSSCNGIDL